MGSIWEGFGGVLGRVWEAKTGQKIEISGIFLDILLQTFILVEFVRFLITSMLGK